MTERFHFDFSLSCIGEGNGQAKRIARLSCGGGGAPRDSAGSGATEEQPTRLPRPWDSPGKNTGVGCHFLLQCMKVKSQSEIAQSCLTLSNPMDCSLPGSSIHRIFQARVSFRHHFMTNTWGNNGNNDRIYFPGLQNHCRW